MAPKVPAKRSNAMWGDGRGGEGTDKKCADNKSTLVADQIHGHSSDEDHSTWVVLMHNDVGAIFTNFGQFGDVARVLSKVFFGHQLTLNRTTFFDITDTLR